MNMANPRDLREEVLVNRGEQLQIIEAATKVGLSKSAFMRSSALKIANDIMRKERLIEAGLLTEDWRVGSFGSAMLTIAIIMRRK